MRTAPWLLAALSLLPACAASPGSPAAPSGAVRSTDDPRVRPLLGQVPPEVVGDVRPLGGPPTSLASLRGNVVFLQFAFPT